jgi:hypothetical protein
VKDLDFPPEPIGHEDLPWSCFQIIAGEVLSAALWPFLKFGANQLDLPDMAEIGRDLSQAKFHSLFLRVTGRDPNGYPFDPAMIFEKGLHLRPPFGQRHGCMTGFGPYASGLFQGDDVCPFFLLNGLLDMFVIVAAVGQDHDLIRLVWPDIVFQIDAPNILHDGFILGPVVQLVFSAIFFGVERDWGHGDQHVPNNQDHIGPLVSNDKALAMVEPLSIVRVPGRSAVDGAVNQQEDAPWKFAF